MILRIEDLKTISSVILSAVDNSNLSQYSEAVELSAKNKAFSLAVTNREYFAEVSLPLDEDESFFAVVNATLFLKLITQITTDVVELTVEENALKIKANGTYNLPLIDLNTIDGTLGKDAGLPRIKIDNPTVNFDISTEILESIANFNSKELLKETPLNPVQYLYYVDEAGAITFTSGACVNSFVLPKPIKMLLPQRIVKLFKLFKSDSSVNFTMGTSDVGYRTQTRVSFEGKSVKLTAILTSDESLIATVPANVIRNTAFDSYMYSGVINRQEFLQGINRLLLFIGNDVDVCKFEFCEDYFIIKTLTGKNEEKIYFLNSIPQCTDYSSYMSLFSIKKALEGCIEPEITFNFGNNVSAVISRGNIYNVIQEKDVF